MKNALKPVRKSTWRSGLDLEYLDETSQVKQEQMERYQREIGKKLKHFNEYASKEKLGEVHVAGFLHDAVARNQDGTGSYPGALTNEERKKRIASVWMKKLEQPVYGRGAQKDVLQHRLVFSMSNELYDKCIKWGINPDSVLHSSMKTVLRKFQVKFHPGDRIGYAYGFHHDTNNPHVHVALCPRTQRNNYVGYSTHRFAKGKSRNLDQYAFMKEAFNAECQRWGETLSSPKKLRVLHSEKECEKFFFHRKYSAAQAASDSLVKPTAYEKLSETEIKLRGIRQEIDSLQRAAKAKKMARLVTNCFGWRNQSAATSLISSAEKLAAVARRQRIKALREQYFLLRKLQGQQIRENHQTSYERSAANRQANYQRCSNSRSIPQRITESIRI